VAPAALRLVGPSKSTLDSKTPHELVELRPSIVIQADDLAIQHGAIVQVDMRRRLTRLQRGRRLIRSSACWRSG